VEHKAETSAELSPAVKKIWMNIWLNLEFPYFFNTSCTFWLNLILFQDIENRFYNWILFQYFQYRVGTLNPLKNSFLHRLTRTFRECRMAKTFKGSMWVCIHSWNVAQIQRYESTTLGDLSRIKLKNTRLRGVRANRFSPLHYTRQARGVSCDRKNRKKRNASSALGII